MREEVFIRLFVRHESELRGFALSLLPSLPDAEDVVQEACVAMWRKIAHLEKEEDFMPWAYTFVRLTAMNRIRKLSRSKLVFSDALVEMNVAEALEESDRVRDEYKSLYHCLEKLPEKQLQLVRAYYRSSKVRMADLAREFDRPVHGLYKALERIRAALRDCIEQRMTELGF